MQFDYGTIDPTTKSGTQLASDLNNFRSAVNSFHRGSSPPPYATAGIIWVDDSSNPLWDYKAYDGTHWIPVFRVNINSNQATPYINGVLATASGTASAANIGTGPNDVRNNSMLGPLATANTVSSANLAVGAVGPNQLQDSSVLAAKLASNSVTTAKIADRAVSLTKLSAGANGGIIRYSSSGLPEYLSAGSENSYLRIRSGVPVWDDSNETFVAGTTKTEFSSPYYTWCGGPANTEITGMHVRVPFSGNLTLSYVLRKTLLYNEATSGGGALPFGRRAGNVPPATHGEYAYYVAVGFTFRVKVDGVIRHTYVLGSTSAERLYQGQVTLTGLIEGSVIETTLACNANVSLGWGGCTAQNLVLTSGNKITDFQGL